MWAAIASKYGDRWIFPIVSNGRLVGGAEKWNMSGCIEVRELDLEDPALLPDALKALDQFMSFYAMMGYDIVRIREVLGKSPENAPAGDDGRARGARLLPHRGHVRQGQDGPGPSSLGGGALLRPVEAAHRAPPPVHQRGRGHQDHRRAEVGRRRGPAVPQPHPAQEDVRDGLPDQGPGHTGLRHLLQPGARLAVSAGPRTARSPRR